MHSQALEVWWRLKKLDRSDVFQGDKLLPQIPNDTLSASVQQCRDFTIMNNNNIHYNLVVSSQ